MSEAKRIFIAINIPEKIKQELFERYSKKLPKNRLKIVEETNLHITILFLGYLTEQAISELEKKLLELKKEKSFNAIVSGIGEFNSRVIWIGTTKGSEEITSIHDKIIKLLEIQDEKFHPHITIARNKELKSVEIKNIIETLGKEKIEFEFKAQSIDIMESKLKPGGAEYLIIKKIELID